MACSNPCNQEHEKHGNGFVCIIVLYILLAIIIGSCIAY